MEPYMDDIVEYFKRNTLFQKEKVSLSTIKEKRKLEDYKRRVRKASHERSHEIIKNGTPEHTNVILSELLHGPSDHLYIYDHNLSGDLLLENEGELLNDFKQFFENKKNGKIEIIIDPDNYSNHTNNSDLIGTLKSIGKSSLEIFKLNSEILSEKKQDINELPYFSVTSANEYRLEPDRTNDRKADVCFNNPDMGESLQGIFRSMKNACNKVA